MKRITTISTLFFLFLFLKNLVLPGQIEKLIAPEEKLNDSFNNFDITTTKLIRFEEHDNALTPDFKLPPDWTFATGKNITAK